MESLTAVQPAMIDEVCQERLEHSLAVGSADRQAAVDGVRQVYESAGLEPPATVVWVDSPLAGMLCAYHLSEQLGNESGCSVRTQLARHVAWRHERRIAQEVRWTISRMISARLDQRTPYLNLNVFGFEQRAGSPLWNRVGQEAHDRIPKHLRGPGPPYKTWRMGMTGLTSLIRRMQHDEILGQFAAYELAEADIFARLADERPRGRLVGIMQVARSAGPWWPMLDAVVLSERPNIVSLDQQGRLHNATGPAVGFRDGWGEYYWHGRSVPADLIESDWTLEQIIRERNSEHRRCAVERAAEVEGWPALIARAGWKQIGDTVPDPGNPGQTLSLYEVRNIYQIVVNLLLMTNGTTERDGSRRVYAETVPSYITDPVAAAAWQIGLSADQYARTVRRT
ncbi:MAG: DUF6745 domain-containing protein [Kibdelosporangium sp.]